MKSQKNRTAIEEGLQARQNDIRHRVMLLKRPLLNALPDELLNLIAEYDDI